MEKNLRRCAVLLFTYFSFASAGILDGYFSSTEIRRQAEALARSFPQLVRLQSLAQTPGGNELFVLCLGRNEDLPGLAIIGGAEGDDLASPPLCLLFADRLCRAAERNDSLSSLLDTTFFFIIPQLNADAGLPTSAAQLPVYERTVNARPTDDDHDGSTDEDGFEDLNGDGLITRMRVSGAGEWTADPQQPQLMRLADPGKGERGVYQFYWEGVDSDRDGLWNEDCPGGVDLNRNFSYRYAFFAAQAGDGPLSEAESRALADFFVAHPNIFAVFSFSSADNLLHPWKGKSPEKDKPLSQPLPQDASFFAQIGKLFKEKAVLPQGPERPAAPGNLAEWLYYHLGFWSFTAPVWLPPADSSRNGDDPLAFERSFLGWCVANQQERRFIPWQRVEHPDFPDPVVEVGGWAPYALKNPPADSLGAAAERYAAFFLALAARGPELMLTLKAERLHAGLYRLTARLGNSGGLPTLSAVGEQIRRSPRLKIEWLGEKGQRLIAGKKFYLLEPLPPGAFAEKSWTIAAKAGGRVKVAAVIPTAGKKEASATLP